MSNELDAKWGQPSLMHDPNILANFNARPTDILITTAPKAGTTWMQQILYQLKTGGETEFQLIDDVVPWLEIQRANKSVSEVLESFESLPNPRIFKTHCTYEQTPGADTVNIILTSRDPRDACISFYHHMMNMTDQACEKIGISKPRSFDEYFVQWMEFGAWYRNVASWWPHINDTNVLWLKYEDMKKDLEPALNQIVEFLQWQLPESNKSKVLEYCSFQWMKKHSLKFTHHDENGVPYFKADTFIRKGMVGDHKTHLSSTQEKEILDRAVNDLPGDCLDFLRLSY